MTQSEFIKILFTEASTGTEALQAAGKDDVVASLAALVTPLQDLLIAVLKGDEVDKREASNAITVLKGVNATIRAALPAPEAPALPAGLKALNADKVIVNKFAKKCSCGTMVEAGAGHAALVRGRWLTVCAECATTTPEDRAAKVQAEHDAMTALMEERKKLAAHVFTTLGTDKNAFPKANVAIPSMTGNNDLDFFTVKTLRNHNVAVLRVIGGHADQAISMDQQVAALRAIVVEDVQHSAIIFGQQLGYCGCCGTHLTDETSRRIGIGPDCRKQYGF